MDEHTSNELQYKKGYKDALLEVKSYLHIYGVVSELDLEDIAEEKGVTIDEN